MDVFAVEIVSRSLRLTVCVFRSIVVLCLRFLHQSRANLAAPSVYVL